MSQTQPALETVGGISLITITGTPRQMGHALGQRLKSRIDVLIQGVLTRIAQLADPSIGLLNDDGKINKKRVKQALQSLLQPCIDQIRSQTPQVWMELESISVGANVDPINILAVHAIDDILPKLAKRAPLGRSAGIMLAPGQRKNAEPCLAMQWRVPAIWTPHLCLIRRIPAHGPATITLGLNGLHTIAGISEAGNAIISHEMHCNRSHVKGIPIPLLIDAALSGPTVDDALGRLEKYHCMGSRAIFCLNRDHHRASLEISAGQAVVLQDPMPDSPRVHTSHPLHQAFINPDAESYDDSRAQMKFLAQAIRGAQQIDVQQISEWFTNSSASLIDTNDNSGSGSCVCVFEPLRGVVHSHMGNNLNDFGQISL